MAATQQEMADRTREIMADTGLPWKAAWRQAKSEFGESEDDLPNRRISTMSKVFIVLGALIGALMLVFTSSTLNSLDESSTAPTHSAQALAFDAALMDAGSTFYLQDDQWEVETVPYGEDGIGLRMGPDLDGSGTWLLLAVRGLLSGQTQQDRFWDDVENNLLSDGMEFATGPEAVSVSGVDGLTGSITGVKGDRTDQSLGAAFAILFDENCDYFVLAQWELTDEASMREYFEYVLDELRLPDDCLAESL